MRTPICLILLLLSVPALHAQNAEAVSRFTLLGQVRDYHTGAPVPGADVEARELKRRVVADSAGRFSFPDLPEGSYTFVTRRLGYVTNVEASRVRRGNVLLVHLLPQAILIEGIEVLADRLETRRKAMAYSSSAHAEQELRASAAFSVADFLHARHGITFHACNTTDLAKSCATFRTSGVMGRQPFRLYVDDVAVPNGAMMLESYQPDDLYRVEVYPGLRMIRIYTPWFIEHVARRGYSLQPICIAC